MKKFKGFSIAEAMITLLIISIALAASAPLMSKKIKSESSNINQITRQETTNSYTYRIWSDGFKEVWMNTTSNGSTGITLPISFSNTNYYVVLGPSQRSNTHPIVFTKYTNKVVLIYREGGGTGDEYPNLSLSIYAAGY